MPIAKVDVDHNRLDAFVSTLVRYKVKHRINTYDGPGGGNPNVDIEIADRAELKAFLLKHYDPDMIDEYFDMYCGVEA